MLLRCFLALCVTIEKSKANLLLFPLLSVFIFCLEALRFFFSLSLKSNNSKLIIHAVFLGNPQGPPNVSIQFFTSGNFSWIAVLNTLFHYFIFFFRDTRSTRFWPLFAHFHFNLIPILFLIYFLIFVLLVVFRLLLSAPY